MTLDQVRQITLEWLCNERGPLREDRLVRIDASLYVRGMERAYRGHNIFALKRPLDGQVDSVLINSDICDTGDEELMSRQQAIEKTVTDEGVECYRFPFSVALRAGLELRMLRVIDNASYGYCHDSLLMAQGRKRVLLEVDTSSNGYWFAASAGRSKTIREAQDRIVPKAAKEAGTFKRQGPWFFIPAEQGRGERCEVQEISDDLSGFTLQDPARKHYAHVAGAGALYKRAAYVDGMVEHYCLKDGLQATGRYPSLEFDGPHRAVCTDVKWFW